MTPLFIAQEYVTHTGLIHNVLCGTEGEIIVTCDKYWEVLEVTISHVCTFLMLQSVMPA